MTTDAALDHRRPRGADPELSQADHAVRLPVRRIIRDQVTRTLPGGSSQWLMPAAGITAPIAHRAW